MVVVIVVDAGVVVAVVVEVVVVVDVVVMVVVAVVVVVVVLASYVVEALQACSCVVWYVLRRGLHFSGTELSHHSFGS